jgi:UDP-N-acetyl-D-mannosaminuronate dehydrogenase
VTDPDLATRPTGKVVIAGQGYVGLPIAMRAVEVGYHVVGYEPDWVRTKRLLSRSSYIEDVTDAVLASALDSGRYEPSESVRACKGFDVAVITVPTPRRWPIACLCWGFREHVGCSFMNIPKW